ncbi:hypothetical protein, partial [Amycolatopsis sp.]|uniref:hypothetical protein n=1 Tax=Amycolatopsis sp. TaxID=37632 RepID=UPI0026310366
PLAAQQDRRRRAGPAPPRKPPDHMIHNDQSHNATTGYSERLSTRVVTANPVTLMVIGPVTFTVK